MVNKCKICGKLLLIASIPMGCRDLFLKSDLCWQHQLLEIIKPEKNPAHFCDCGKYLGHRGFCSQECHDKHWDMEDE